MQCNAFSKKIKFYFQVCYPIDFVDMKYTLHNFLMRMKLSSSYVSMKHHFIKVNLFNLFLLSNQKYPPHHHTFQISILAKFPIQFNLIYILYCRCLHHFSKFFGSHLESIMVNLQRLRTGTCYYYFGTLILFKIKMPLQIEYHSQDFSKWQFVYLEYLRDIE